MQFIGHTKEEFYIEDISGANCHILKEQIPGALSILWFETNNNRLEIDGKEVVFHKNQIVFLTEFHKVKPISIGQVRFVRFNRSFYCVLSGDAEIGCKGLLFFGATQLPVITIANEEERNLKLLWQVFLMEMQSDDNLQIEMLQMLLKRYLILCTRIYKSQKQYDALDSDLIRQFNYLVEEHHHKLHTVAAYAKLLHKSPKTLSNIFAQTGNKTPLQYIQDRIMLAARRLLHYSDNQVQEIAYELGYEDVQSFSRFFKRHEGVSPNTYKLQLQENAASGKIVNS